MKNRKNWLAQISLAVFAGFAVFGLSFYVAWNTARKQYDASSGQYLTRSSMQKIGNAIREYKEKNGVLPPSLEGFGYYGNQDFDFYGTDNATNKIVTPLDGWQRPFEYSIQGDTYLLISYGEDGKPGGIGVDCDLTNLRPNPPDSALTLAQFWNEPVLRYVRNPA